MNSILKKIEKFFWWVSGAKVKILEELPTEHSKYTGIGGTIFFTALMATFAGGYAINTAFKSLPLSIFFGVFWGSLIFNLDRYIVSSFGVGDGKRTISKQELIEASPRIIMAIILGFVIATPLELKLFEKEINAEIDQKIAISNRQLEQNIQKNTSDIIIEYKDEIKSLKNKIENRDKILEAKRQEYFKADEAQRNEWNGLGPTGKKGKGPYWEELNNRKNELKTELDKIETQYSKQNQKDRKRIEYLQKLVDAEELKKIKETEFHKTIQQQNDGLMARLEALHDLTRKKTALLFANWLITLLFIIIEIAPIMFKMMMETGPYDQEVDRLRYEKRIRNMQSNSNLNESINFDLKIHTKKNEQRLEEELKANEELLKKIAKIQVEIASVAIEEWKNEQLKKVKNNPSSMIKS